MHFLELSVNTSMSMKMNHSYGIQRHLKDFIYCLKEIPQFFRWYVSLHVPTVSGLRGMHTVFILFQAVYFLIGYF